MCGRRCAWIVPYLCVLAVSCGGPAAPAASTASATDVATDSVVPPANDVAADQHIADLAELPKDAAIADVVAGNDAADAAADADDKADTDASVQEPDGAFDVPGPDAIVDCPGAPGCPCTDNAGCDTGWCIDSAAGLVCGQLCTSDCPEGFACAQLGGAGDPQYVCVSKWGWRCDPCVASSQCAAPGQPDARCITSGKNGSFCGSACAGAAKDCGTGYTCQDVTTVEGAVQAQCVPVGGVCGCSPRAVKLQLSTTCSSADGAGCKGKRMCAAAGLSPCDAPAASTEVCDGGDNDCDGATDEGTCDDANPCTSDACAVGGCSHTANDGASCNDGEPCTTQDACVGGVCTGGANVCGCQADADCAGKSDGDLCKGVWTCSKSTFPYACALDPASVVTCPSQSDSACLHSTCNPATGVCAMAAAPSTTSCEDGNACTIGDVCQQGTCVGLPAACTDASNCTIDGCDAGSGCTHVVSTGACDDANTCTTDSCGAAGCVHSAADDLVCTDGNPCTSGDVCAGGSCQSGTNLCGCESDSDCAAQEDGNLCNGTLLCDKSKFPYSCAVDAKTVVTCSTAGDTTCAKNVCAAASGLCGMQAVSGNVLCEDGNPCTSGDVCAGGSCQSGTNLCGCESDGDCAAQEDGNLCNGTLLCDKSKFPYSCAVDAKTVVTCSTAGDTTCAKNVCAAASGLCGMQAVSGNVLCEDGNQCTSGDVCAGGSCQSGTNLCGCESDGDCAAQEDGNLCNGTLLCDKSKFPYSCAVDAKTVVTCSTAGDTTCAKNVCAAASGLCGMQAVSGNVLCEDGNPCTSGDVCAGGSCQSGTNLCGCESDGDCAAQEDGNLCNGTLLCDKSKFPYSCAVDAKTVVTCSTSGDTTCAKNVCAAASGLCGMQAVSGNVLCEDGNPCTSGDVCAGGSCQSGTNLCGCESDSDCAAQEDGNLCNGTLLCDKSKFPYSCAVDAKTVVTCSTAGDTTCAKNVCAAASGLCGMQAATNGTLCTDGNACTLLDACAAGSCTGQPDPCLDSNPCTDDVCNPASGCAHPANAAPCDDGNPCTLIDTCGSATCNGGVAPTCTDTALNGNETGIDCGGQTGACGFAPCQSCGTGQGCLVPADCSSGVCALGHCAAPSCSDSVANGGETGIDCGGPCMVCPVVLIVAGGGASVAATLPIGGSWSSSPLGVPTVDGVSIAPYADKAGEAGAVAVLRYTRYSDLLDNTVQYAVWNGSGWGPAKQLGAGVTTQNGPAVTFTGSTAQVVFHGFDFHNYFGSFDGSTWTGVEGVGNPSSYGPSAPVIAATSAGSTALWMSGANANRVTARSRSAGGWGAEVDVGPAVDYSISPALVAPTSDAELLATIVGSDGQVWWQGRYGGTWSGQAKVANAWTKNRTALATTASGQVILAFRGMDAKVYTSLWAPGSASWTTPTQVGSPGSSCLGTPAVARGTKGADAELAWVAADGTVWHARLASGAWSTPQSVATGAVSVAVTALP